MQSLCRSGGEIEKGLGECSCKLFLCEYLRCFLRRGKGAGDVFEVLVEFAKSVWSANFASSFFGKNCNLSGLEASPKQAAAEISGREVTGGGRNPIDGLEDFSDKPAADSGG